MRRFFRSMLAPDQLSRAADAATRYARQVSAQTESACKETAALIQRSKLAERRYRSLAKTLPPWGR